MLLVIIRLLYELGEAKYALFTVKCVNVPSLSFSETLSKNRDVRVWVLFSSLRGRVRFGLDFCTFFTFGFLVTLT